MKAKLFGGITLVAMLALALPGHSADTTSIFETLDTLKEHTILYVAVKESGEVTTLKGQGAYTLFAPTDVAFKKLDDETIKKIATDKATVQQLLKSHLV